MGRHRASILIAVGLLAPAAATTVAVSASAARVAPPSGSARDASGLQIVDQFVRELASVGVRVYTPRAAVPLRTVRAPVSPLRLTADQARVAALGALSHTGLTGAKLDSLTGPIRLTPKLSVGLGVVVAGWAKRARTPSAALARRILGKPQWKRYRQVIFPSAVVLLFASDVAVHLGGSKGAVARHQSVAVTSAAEPCTSVQSFIDGTIEAVFKAIGHISTNQTTIRKLFGGGFLGQIVKGIGDVLSVAVNTVVDAVHAIVVGGVRVATGLVTSTVAAIVGPAVVVGQIATALLPWTGTIQTAPNPTSKGVGSGIAGTFSLAVAAPGSDLNLPDFVLDCARAFNVPLPSLKPTNADVRWNISNQSPAGLIVGRGDSGSLDAAGTARLRFETTTEPAKLAATGQLRTGMVVATASIHRKDLDQLGDRISQGVIAALPAIIRDTVGAVLRAKLKPLIDAATAKIATVRDVQATGLERVQYHVPKPNKPTGGGKGGPGNSCTLQNAAAARFRVRDETALFVADVQGNGPFTRAEGSFDGKTYHVSFAARGCSDARGAIWLMLAPPGYAKLLTLKHGRPTFSLPATGGTTTAVDIHEDDTTIPAVHFTRILLEIARPTAGRLSVSVRQVYREQSPPEDFQNPFHGSGQYGYNWSAPIVKGP